MYKVYIIVMKDKISTSLYILHGFLSHELMNKKHMHVSVDLKIYFIYIDWSRYLLWPPLWKLTLYFIWTSVILSVKKQANKAYMARYIIQIRTKSVLSIGIQKKYNASNVAALGKPTDPIRQIRSNLHKQS